MKQILLKLICTLLMFFTNFVFAHAIGLGLIGPNGEVFLFYANDGVIVIKECKKHTVLNKRADCVQKPGTEILSIPSPELQEQLKSVLNLASDSYTAEMQRKIELYQKGEDDLKNAEELEKQRSEIKLELDEIQEFIDEYGEDNADLDRKKYLEEQLSEIEQTLAHYKNTIAVIRELDQKIEDLVNDIIGGATLTKLIHSQNPTSFEFNVLKNYLDNPGVMATFIEIAAGTFIMGSPPDESQRNSDETQYRVTLSKGFQIQTTEVTQLQYYLIMGQNPSTFKEKSHCNHSHSIVHDIQLCPENPVEQVSWKDTQKFIAILNQRDDRYNYRLPTEAEWEYAARSGTQTAFNLGPNISPDQVNYNGQHSYKEAPKGIYRAQTIPVGSLANMNALGLYDIHGNVQEWTQDTYGDYPIHYAIDPQGAPSGPYRVLRGGSWSQFGHFLRSANRNRQPMTMRSGDVGFRLVRVPIE